jgi:divalent metal cation (Fe/Co/Zn/Cd) transporter
MVEMRSLLIGEGAGPREMLAIRQAIAGTPGVDHVIHIRTDYLGPDELLVGAKVAFDQHLDVAGLAAAVDRVEDAVRAVVPHARPMYVEPDLHRTEGSRGETAG